MLVESGKDYPIVNGKRCAATNNGRLSISLWDGLKEIHQQKYGKGIPEDT